MGSRIEGRRRKTENPLDLAPSWVDGRFVFRSGFYAGRPPSLGDLNSNILEAIYSGIKRDVGEEEGTNFVRFVNNLDDLSASAFIVAFEFFCANDCKRVDFSQKPEDRRRLDGRGRGLEVEAFGLIGEVMFGRKMSNDEIRSISNSIKSQFILHHQLEIPKDEVRKTSLRRDRYSFGNSFYE